MKKHHQLFEDYLTANDGRYTAQKRAIVDEIFKMKTHFEIEDFIEAVRKKDAKTFSRATVYRTIKQLFDANLIQKVTTLDGKVYYEKSAGPGQHDHLICNACGDIIEIKDHVIEDHVRDFCDGIGFVPEYRSLHVYGRCQKCLD